MTVRQLVMERGHAVGVLGYDASRDEVVLANELRPGMLAAGEYQVKMQQPNVLRIMTTDGKQAAMILTRSRVSRKPQTESRLMFNRYGDTYFLSQVWVIGAETGVELPKTSAEIELAKRTTCQDAAVVAQKR